MATPDLCSLHYWKYSAAKSIHAVRIGVDLFHPHFFRHLQNYQVISCPNCHKGCSSGRIFELCIDELRRIVGVSPIRNHGIH